MSADWISVTGDLSFKQGSDQQVLAILREAYRGEAPAASSIVEAFQNTLDTWFEDGSEITQTNDDSYTFAGSGELYPSHVENLMTALFPHLAYGSVQIENDGSDWPTIYEALDGRGTIMSVHSLAVGSLDTPIQDLHLYAQVSNSVVRADVAKHLRCPQELLAKLATDSEEAVRMAVAANPFTPGELLLQLVKDGHAEIAKRALSNPNCPDHIRALHSTTV